MSLRSKVTILMAVVLIADVAAVVALQRYLVYPSFVALEEEEVQKDLSRCVDAIAREIEHLNSFTRDWGGWTDTYEFVNDRNAEYMGENLTAEVLGNNDLDYVAYYKPDGTPVWTGGFDEAGEAITIDPWRQPAAADHPLIHHAGTDGSVSGIVLTNHGPMLIAAQPILTSEREGPIRGSLIMGRLLDGERVAQLSELTRVDLHVAALGDGLAESDRAMAALLSEEAPRGLQKHADMLHAFTTLADIHGEPTLFVRANVVPDITGRGWDSLVYATASTVAAGSLILVALWLVLHLGIIRPLSRLTRHAIDVGRDSDLTARLGSRRRDELGALARAFDDMVASLAESRRNVVDTAHRAGMAEIATEVLHNVGNALNTVNVSTQVVEEKLRDGRTEGLTKAVGMLREHQHDLPGFFARDPRAPKLVDYLGQLSAALSEGQASALDEMERLQARVDDIRRIIDTQQTHATAMPMLEDYDLTEIVDDALRMSQPALSRASIVVEREFEPFPPVPVERAKLLQVIANLVSNAADSMIQAGGEGHRLTVRIRRAGEAVEIAVADTGVGLDPAVKARMFEYGYTTKPHGHGFGLHYCANAVSTMGGSLTADNVEGRRGAVFLVRLPAPLASEIKA